MTLSINCTADVYLILHCYAYVLCITIDSWSCLFFLLFLFFPSILVFFFFFFFNQKTAYDVRISDWSSDVCSSDLDGESAEQRPVNRPRKAERPADPAEAQDLLQPAHFGNAGIKVDASAKRMVDQGAHQLIADDEPLGRSKAAVQAKARDFGDAGTARHLLFAQLRVERAENVWAPRVEQTCRAE